MAEDDQQHAPEPWAPCDNPRLLVDATRGAVATFHGGDETQDRRNANMRRTVAAINACKGIPVAALEQVDFANHLAETALERAECREAIKDALRVLESAISAGCDDPETERHALEGHHTLVRLRRMLARLS